MIERTRQRFGLQPDRLAADAACGSGRLVGWLMNRGIEPHVPVLDREAQTKGLLTRAEFSFDRVRDMYVCLAGHDLKTSGQIVGGPRRAARARGQGGRPPNRPRRRAAASPSRVRAAIRSHSNWAIAANTWNTSRPAGVVVVSSAMLRKPAPWAWMGATIPRRSRSDRLRRSYLVTTTTSPGRSWSINRSSSGREMRVPNAALDRNAGQWNVLLQMGLQEPETARGLQRSKSGI
ncbi:hypothetical protein IC63_15615 [Paracoccus sphaerophysae]|uniref:Uncharacterized protein n=1 Tax=Paracoccus sphaerophysae TaxID=690417 RepID=A0A099EVE0_9RHOB|nr:hypothetical protein IC63_15615 [Paracoccus sphaerophysae]